MKWITRLKILAALMAFLLFSYVINYVIQQVRVQSTILRDFVGDYYLGDGFINWHLSITSDLQYYLNEYPPISYPTDYHGKILIVKDRVYLVESNGSPETPERLNAIIQTADNLIPVMWDARRYLVWASLLTEFCQTLPRENLRFGSVYLRERDWNTPAGGHPTLADGKTLVCP